VLQIVWNFSSARFSAAQLHCWQFDKRGLYCRCCLTLADGLGSFLRCRLGMKSAIAAIAITVTSGSVLAQTQRTPPSAFATFPTMPSAFATAPLSPCYGRRSYWAYRSEGTRRYRWSSFNPTSPCYSGTPYPYYSAFEPFQTPGPTSRPALPGAASLNENEARARIEAKGYLNISSLVQDRRGIWRGEATMNDGGSVDVVVDLEGNIYSELSTLHIWIERAPPQKKNR
jgi:hypothetical protein